MDFKIKNYPKKFIFSIFFFEKNIPRRLEIYLKKKKKILKF